MREDETLKVISFHELVFESDSKAAIDEVNSTAPSWAPHGQLLEELKRIININNHWTISFKPRKRNKAAH